MKKSNIKRHLSDYSIFNKRKTTINHAFASALSVADWYDDEKINRALRIIGQNPEQDLECVYCSKPAETWDHINGIVKNSKFSGYGHQLGNLIPCCKDCNSKKGNRDWKAFVEKIITNKEEQALKIQAIEEYIKENTSDISELLNSTCEQELDKLNKIKEQVFELLKEADNQAKQIREKIIITVANIV